MVLDKRKKSENVMMVHSEKRKVNVGGNINLITKFGSRKCGGGEREECGRMVKEKLNIVWEINVKRIWRDIKMVKAYLMWSIHGLAAAPHCGIVGEHIIIHFLSIPLLHHFIF